MLRILIVYSLVFFFSTLSLNYSLAQDLDSLSMHSNHTYIPGYGIKKKKNTSLFQGNRERKKYFEGWYFKMVSADGASILSVIPGISLSENGEEQHAFIQLIDGKTAETLYYTFPIDEFRFSDKKFAVRIGDNYFSEDSLRLNIQDQQTTIVGQVKMSNQVKLSPKNKEKIMGWYRFVPFMQCYHGVVSLNHDLDGTLSKNGQDFNFDNGLGYIEKDWGTSMPSAWVWIQSNNFTTENTSFMLSVANIPWLGSSFPGFLGFFLNDGKVHRFATYTGAKLKIETIDSESLKIRITDREFVYEIITHRNQSGMLKAPVNGSMDRRIAESVDAELMLNVYDRDSNLIFSDSTNIAGLETVGDSATLTKSNKKNK